MTLRTLTIIGILCCAVANAVERQIIYDTDSGRIVARESLTCSFGGLAKNRAVIIADIPDTVTHVTEQTIPPGQRKKVVRAKKSTDTTTDTLAAVDALIEAVGDKKTRDALKAIKALIVEELPDK